MNAPAHISATTPLLDFDAAYARLNQWRGHMVENFARSEQAVTETLALLNTTKLEVKGVKYPHLVGQRYDRLTNLMSAMTAPSGHTKVALAALAKFRTHDGLRTMLCHGVTKVAIDAAGEWVALMTLTSFKSAAMSTDKLTVLEIEGRAMLDQLNDCRRKLCTALGQVRRETSAAA